MPAVEKELFCLDLVDDEKIILPTKVGTDGLTPCVTSRIRT